MKASHEFYVDALGCAWCGTKTPYIAPMAPDAGANLHAYVTRILPTLAEREQAVVRAMRDYFTTTRYPDVTGGELAEFAGLEVTWVRPRLTGLTKRGVLRVTASKRQSRSAKETTCHAYYFPAVMA